MRITVLSVLLALTAFSLHGQERLARGEKAPELLVSEWITQGRPALGRAMMVEFFHPDNSRSVERIALLDQMARSYSGSMSVVVITRENDARVRELLDGKAFFAAVDDDGKTFSAYSAFYVPYAVIADRRGRVTWLGNPTSLTEADITQYIR